MLLAVIVGNNYTHFCLMPRKECIPEVYFSTSTDTHRSADKYSTFLVKKFNDVGITYNDIKDMIVSSTIPPINTIMREFACRFLNLSPIIVGEDPIDWGFKIDIPNPKEAPPDILVDAVAANSLYGSPSLIINFGTITTMVVTNNEGNPCGAIIAPGYNLIMKSFCSYSGITQEIPLLYPNKIVGKTMEEALQAGIVWGHVHMVRVLIQQVLVERNPNMLVIATGSYLEHFKEHIPEITYWDPMLTMQGLYQLYEQNKYLLMNRKVS